MIHKPNAGINEYRENGHKKQQTMDNENTRDRSVTPVNRGLSAQVPTINDKTLPAHARDVIYVENSAEALADKKIMEERSSECQ